MNKKFYLYTKAATIPYWIMSVIFSGIIALGFVVDEMNSGVIITMSFFAVTIAILITWSIILPKLRIEIDYEKKELFYWNDYYRRRIKFEDIRALEIVEHREKVTFGCKITTNTKIRRFGYTRYYRKKPTPEILAKVEEVKDALRSIPISNQ